MGSGVSPPGDNFGRVFTSGRLSNGRAYATVLCPPVVRLVSNVRIVAKQWVLKSV